MQLIFKQQRARCMLLSGKSKIKNSTITKKKKYLRNKEVGKTYLVEPHF